MLKVQMIYPFNNVLMFGPHTQQIILLKRRLGTTDVSMNQLQRFTERQLLIKQPFQTFTAD